MKEKIGMERLVMLLDIYEEEVVGVHSVGEHITEKDEAWIISKKFGFIKWLVENDKIDFKKNKLQVLKDIDVRGEVMYDYTLFDKVDGVIMLLSISDTPIEDLISYLK